jgi:hypothetical protein
MTFLYVKTKFTISPTAAAIQVIYPAYNAIVSNQSPLPTVIKHIAITPTKPPIKIPAINDAM